MNLSQKFVVMRERERKHLESPRFLMKPQVSTKLFSLLPTLFQHLHFSSLASFSSVGAYRIHINMAPEFNFEDSAGNLADTKRPDCFIESDKKSYPRIVVEVGYSETFDELIKAAHR
jgi:hypothetical protein